MTPVLIALVLLPFACFAYAYAGYPAILWLLARRRAPRHDAEPGSWPRVTVTVPAYNEERAIAATLDHILSLDYPADRRDVLVVSDASTDRTDEIVRSYADRGVRLLRMPQRSGKSEAENAAGQAATGDVVVNVDACIRVPRHALKALVRAFADPTVGVASGRDVSVGAVAQEANGAESGYVGYEMWVRSLETRLGSIVGASGCFYGIRRDIHDTRFPAELSRDFASALIAREHGLRAVSVEDAICYVPRTTALQAEYRRKVRTMARGLATLWFKRHLMNPLRHGLFAFMLVSHKLFRWLGYLLLAPATLALLWLATQSTLALALAAAGGVVTVLGVLALRWPDGLRVPRAIAVPGFAVASIIAGMLAWLELLRGRRASIWEPTRRPA